MHEPETERIGKDKVFAALSSIVRSGEFAASPQLASFLTFSVRQTLEGQGQSLKAYTIATEVLGRSANFDPQNDPIVRVEATRLRRAIDRYYATDGAQDRIRITMPKGAYSVLFEDLDHRPAAPSRPVPDRDRRRDVRFSVQTLSIFTAAVLLACGAAGVGWWFWSSRVQDGAAPVMLSLQLPTGPAPEATKPISAIALAKPIIGWKPRVAAVAIKHDAITKSLMEDIVNIMIRFDGIAVYEDMLPPDPVPDDFYTLEGVSREGSEARIDLRLIHALSGRILLSRSLTMQGAAEAISAMALKAALEIAGRDGVIRTDSLAEASPGQSAGISAHACLAVVHVGIKTQDKALMQQARKCLDSLLRTSTHSAILLALSADLRRNEPEGDLEKSSEEARLALALEPKNTTAMQVLSDLMEAKNLAAALRMGDMALENNPYDPVFLRSQARRLNAAGRVGRAELLLADAEKIE